MKAGIKVSRQQEIGRIDERLYSSFLEHMGRAVYEGVYEPSHKTSDGEGFRQDVSTLCQALKIPMIRYPGGNFVSGYEWQDGIGPKEQRPVRLELAWQSIETNQFGLHEFMSWCQKIGSQAMMAVNLGTRGISEARNLLEYCNFSSGTYWSDLRRKNGQEEPFAIKTWCLGNEMDGPWQIGHKTAEEYGRLAEETAKVMKLVDPTIELVVCGSSFREMPTYGEWEQTVLRHTYEHVDYLSLHQYYGNQEDDIGKYLARAVEMSQFIQEVTDICDQIQLEKQSDKQMMLSFDEWNIWYHTLESDKEQTLWQEAPPLLQDIYTFEDALLLGSMLITLLKHADRVKIACLAQLVNVIAPIMTEKEGPAWKQTIYYPFQQVSHYGRGVALATELAVDHYVVEGIGEIPFVDSVTVYQPDDQTLTIFAINRHQTSVMEVELVVEEFVVEGGMGSSELAGYDLKAINTKDQQRVVPCEVENYYLEGQSLQLTLAPLSWNVIRLKVK